MDHTLIAVVVAQVVGFLGLVVTQVSSSRKASAETKAAAALAQQNAKAIADQMRARYIADEESEKRKRKWALEDREATQKHRQKVEMQLTDVGVKVEEVAHKADIASENAVMAYKEANTLNLKIADVGLKMADGTKPNPNEPAAPAQKKPSKAKSQRVLKE